MLFDNTLFYEIFIKSTKKLDFFLDWKHYILILQPTPALLSLKQNYVN